MLLIATLHQVWTDAPPELELVFRKRDRPGQEGASPEINSSVDGLRCKITTNGWLPAASNSPVIPLLSYLFEKDLWAPHPSVQLAMSSPAGVVEGAKL